MIQRQTLNLTEAAKYSGLSTAALREYINHGTLRHVRHHTRKLLFKTKWLDDLLEYLADQTMDELRTEAQA